MVNETTVTIWNSGTVTVRAEDVRQPLRIRTDDAATFIAAKITQSRTPLDPNFSLNSVSDHEIEVDWKLLDPGTALTVAILHNANPNSISVSGVFKPGVTVK